ncbi:DegT/DnrJ/EryC1/StrS family aminotransferase, partial [Arcobacter sp. HD9-500m-PIT-SAG03]
MICFANPKEQYLSHKDEIQEAINRVLDSGWYILGEEVKSFEKEFATFVGTQYSLGVASGTDAIFLSLKALDIGLGDEVITVSHTATATVSAIEATGAKAILVDIEEDYFTIDPKKIEKEITPNTKAIIAVHIYGHPSDVDELIRICKKYDLFLLEDCAQANGAKYKGKKVGSLGDLGCFSFFPTKNLGALGDGGAITTDSLDLYNKLIMLRQYGWDENRESKFQGYNSRLDELQAAILRVKLKYLKQDVEKRNTVASLYNKYLKNTNLILPKVRNDCYHAYHL